MRAALKQEEQSAPCIMLIDEVEKLFHTNTDASGVTSRLLSSILWWLQEHSSKVLTIMTTNKESDIPPELHRAGRIDREVRFEKLSGSLVTEFADELLNRIAEPLGLHIEPYNQVNYPKTYSHAEITEDVINRVKRHYLKQEG